MIIVIVIVTAIRLQPPSPDPKPESQIIHPAPILCQSMSRWWMGWHHLRLHPCFDRPTLHRQLYCCNCWQWHCHSKAWLYCCQRRSSHEPELSHSRLPLSDHRYKSPAAPAHNTWEPASQERHSGTAKLMKFPCSSNSGCPWLIWCRWQCRGYSMLA